MAARELDQADFDLDRFVDLFDEAMTSKDPRVIETLRSLMMIVALTRSEAGTKHSSRDGPLRRLVEDIHNLNRRVTRMEEGSTSNRWRGLPNEEDKYTLRAAAMMSQQIDQDVLNRLNSSISASKDWK